HSPAPISPTTSPSTVTFARETRCTSARTRADPTVCAVLTLTGDDLIVTLDPEQGGRIASIVAFGEERLVRPPSGDPGPRPSSWGAFPMIPWAGRIKHGKFTFDGVNYEMPINHPPHAMHGIAYTSEWIAVDGNTMRLPPPRPVALGGPPRTPPPRHTHT